MGKWKTTLLTLRNCSVNNTSHCANQNRTRTLSLMYRNSAQHTYPVESLKYKSVFFLILANRPTESFLQTYHGLVRPLWHLPTAGPAAGQRDDPRRPSCPQSLSGPSSRSAERSPASQLSSESQRAQQSVSGTMPGVPAVLSLSGPSSRSVGRSPASQLSSESQRAQQPVSGTMPGVQAVLRVSAGPAVGQRDDPRRPSCPQSLSGPSSRSVGRSPASQLSSESQRAQQPVSGTMPGVPAVLRVSAGPAAGQRDDPRRPSCPQSHQSPAHMASALSPGRGTLMYQPLPNTWSDAPKPSPQYP